MAPVYASVEDLRAFLRVTDDVDDAQMALALSAAESAIDNATKRSFTPGTVSSSRVYTGRWAVKPGSNPYGYDAWNVGFPFPTYTVPTGYVADIDDAVSISAVDADWDASGAFASPITGWQSWPLNAVAKGFPIEQVRSSAALPTAEGRVRVTGVFGWPAVPDAVKDACLLQASRFLARRDSPFGVAGSPATGGGELRLLAKVDPDVAVIVERFRRKWWAL